MFLIRNGHWLLSSRVLTSFDKSVINIWITFIKLLAGPVKWTQCIQPTSLKATCEAP